MVIITTETYKQEKLMIDYKARIIFEVCALFT